MIVFWIVGIIMLALLVWLVNAWISYKQMLAYKRQERYLNILPTLLK